NNSFLTSLANRWKTQRSAHMHPTRIVCAYEKIPVLPLFVRPIVAQSSAVALCDAAADASAEDHIGIVKPSGTEHASYKILVNALRALDPVAETKEDLMDVGTLTLFAQIPDPKVRIALYKKMTQQETLHPAVLDFHNRIQLTDGAASKYTI